MSANEYQEFTNTTAIYPPGQAIQYLALGLAGEAGEVANKVKKLIRDDGDRLTADRREAIIDEIGDCLWYIAQLCECMDVSIGNVMGQNAAKLQDRLERDTLHGDGDTR